MKSLKKFQPFFLILVIAFIAYGQTLKMYFFQDDSALIFKLQNPAGPAGSFGEGIVGAGAYKYLAAHYILFYPFFKLEPFWYFLIGFLSFLLVVLLLYIFTKELFKETKIAYFTSLIFASGYIGSEIMFRIINSWQTNIGLILALLSLLFFSKFLRNKQKVYYYFFSILLFLACLEFVYVRSHSLIFVFVALDLLFSLIPFKIVKLRGFVLRQLPYIAIFYLYYIKGVLAETSGLSSTFSLILQGRIENLSSLFATAGNGLVPDFYQFKLLTIFPQKYGIVILVGFLSLSLLILFLRNSNRIFKVTVPTLMLFGYWLVKYFYSKNLYWFQTREAFISAEIGILANILIISVSLLFWKNKYHLGKLLLFGYIFYISQIFGYYTKYPDAIFSTTHRYLSYASLGYAVIFGVISFMFVKNIRKKVFYLPLILVLASNLILSFTYQRKVVHERSIPTRKFYKDLVTFVPKVEKDSIFYFDVNDDDLVQRQFRDFFSVGSMPDSTALAIYYGVDRYDISLIRSFDELLSVLSSREKDINKVYTFYYGRDGLTNTTGISRRLLLLGSGNEILNIKNHLDNKITISGNVPTVVLNKLEFLMRIVPSFGSLKYTNSSSFSNSLLTLEYLASRKSYYQNARAESTSEWKYQEIENVVDNNTNTSWKGHRIYWHDNKADRVTVDLGKSLEISKINWVNRNKYDTPSDYSVQISTDKSVWKTVKEVVKGSQRTDSEIVEEHFEPAVARYIRMNITGTISDDSPSISEFEVVESKFDKVRLSDVSAFLENPLSDLKNVGEAYTIYSKLSSLVNISVSLETDKGFLRDAVKIPAYLDGRFHIYTVFIPQYGTQLQSLTLSLDLPVKLEVLSSSFKSLTLDDARKGGLIRRFKEN